ncbi:MAG: hypothetical protein KDD53_05745 [Bdellovibrionales bacterium]|nr:hypothetical protein [Bdellovibrionales bacterium]
MATTIYVRLLSEAVDTWRPIEAEQLSSDIFRILSINPDLEDETWEFNAGDTVRCTVLELYEGPQIVAIEAIESTSI